MKAFNLICSESVETNESSLKIINPIGNLELSILPNNYSIAITFSVSEFDLENNKVDLHITNNGTSVFHSEGFEVNVPSEFYNKKNEVATIVVNLNNFELNYAGEYVVEVLNKEEILTSSLFYVTNSAAE